MFRSLDTYLRGLRIADRELHQSLGASMTDNDPRTPGPGNASEDVEFLETARAKGFLTPEQVEEEVARRLLLETQQKMIYFWWCSGLLTCMHSITFTRVPY